MKSPHFLIIGAQKCGTSWLHRQLRKHPDVFMPAGKDGPFFFNDEGETQRFLELFEAAPANSVIGYAGAAYFWTRNTGPYPQGFNPDISSAISRELGKKMKLILLLKDPVRRSVSAYLHHIAHGSLDSACSILATPPELGIVSMSRYGRHLEHWQQDYPADRLLMLPAPDSKTARSVLDAAAGFLSLTGRECFGNPEEVVFAGLPRVHRDDGIWVSLNDQKPPNRADSLEIEGRTFYRLVRRDELESLEAELRLDRQLYADLFAECI